MSLRIVMIFVSIFEQRLRRLAVLELSSFLVVGIVLFEIQKIRDGRPPIPLFEHQLIAEAHRYNC